MNEYAEHQVHNLAECVAKYYIDAYDELNGAKTYIMEALDLNRTNRKMADRRQMRSFDELNHAAGIMEDVEIRISEAESAGDATAATVRTMWSAMKDRLMGYMAWIKTLHAEYKGM